MKSTESKAMQSPWTYFIATFIWTWGLCAILISIDMSAVPLFAGVLLILAMIGPGITGILFIHLTKSREEARDYWKRIIDVKRITLSWLAIVVVLPFGFQLLAGVFDGIAGGIGLNWGKSAAAFISNTGSQLLTLCIISLVPFLEEMGWRGYAQDRLQEKHNALGASLILGIVWSLWHLPAFFIPGTYHAGLGIGTLECWLFFVGVIAVSVVVSWIYINTGRSILVMAIFHAIINFSGELIALSKMGEIIYTFCWLAAAVGIMFCFGKGMQVKTGKTQMLHWRPITLLSLSVLGLMFAMALYHPAPANSLELKARFQSELETLHEQYQFPGATAAYILPDGTVEVVAIGLSDVEFEIPMTPQSRMLAASIGKTFVGATVLALVQEGVLNLDDPISKWLDARPWFSRLPNHDMITVRQLLNHSSGITNHVETVGFIEAFRKNRGVSANPLSPEELITYVLDKPPLFHAGEGWYYSDTGYILIGLIIEEVTGHSYYEEVSRRFLVPLRLTLTTPSDRVELPGLASGYLAPNNIFDLPVKTTIRPGAMAWHPGVEWTGGGFVSNPKDLVVWAKALYEGHVINGDYLEDLLQSVPISGDDPDTQYGVAVAIHENGPLGTTYGHSGWIPGYCSSLRYYPRYGVAIAFQINTDIGIVDGSTQVFNDMENRLAKVVIAAVRK